MPVNPFTHLRLLNTTTTTHALSLTKTTLSLMKPTHSLKNTHFLCRIFPFKLKYLALSRPQHRLFSSRPRQRGSGRAAAEFRSSGSGLSSGSGSKSLVDEEAELSDWVSELRTSSNLRGMVTGDEEESERFGARRTGRSRNSGGGERERERERERDGFSVKRRRGEERGSFPRSDSMGKRWGGREFGNVDRRDRSRSARSVGFDDRSDKKRGPFLRRESQFGSDLDDDEKEEKEGYGSRSGKRVGRGNVGRRNGMRGGREQDSGLKRDRWGAVKGRGGFSENDVSGFDDTEGRETLMKGIGDLLGDEDSDGVDEIEDGDADIDNHVRSSFGFEKEVSAKSTTISSGKSDSYLSETR